MDVLRNVINAIVVGAVGLLLAWLMKGRLEAIDRRFEAIETRIDRLEERLGSCQDQRGRELPLPAPSLAR